MARCLAVLCLLVASSLAATPRGVIESTLNGRIVGGLDAPEGEFPYQISLQYEGQHNCGGSIVTSEYVITAAHCLEGYPVSSLSVVAGINKLSGQGTTHKVLEAHYHERFTNLIYVNDVGIMKVEPITFSDKIKPIVAETEYVGGAEDVTLSGWGRTSYPGPIPDHLQFIPLKTLTVEECKSKHVFPPIVGTELCTFTKSGEGACKGDSGGPLVRTVDGEKKLVGIVSWGRPCATGVPDVFARVSSYIDWFNDKCNNCLV